MTIAYILSNVGCQDIKIKGSFSLAKKVIYICYKLVWKVEKTDLN